MSLLTVPLYAAVLALIFVALSARAIRLRGRLRIAVGDADNPEMLRAMRVHSNFAEYVPLTLLLLFFVEIFGGPLVLVHVLGCALVAGRISHAWGVSQAKERFGFRIFGMAATFTALVVAAGYLLYAYAMQLPL